jgi:DNA primase
MTALQAELKQSLSAAAARAAQNAPTGGASVSADEVRRAIDQLRPATLAAIVGQMLRGDTDAATNTLIVNTPLSRTEVEQIVQGMSATVTQMQQRAEQAADQAAEYSAAALWTLFASSVLGLVLAVWGGWLGARGAVRGKLARETA